jgi:hypothetical protein
MKTKKNTKTKTKKNTNPTNKKTKTLTKTKTKNQQGGNFRLVDRNNKRIHNLVYTKHNIKTNAENKVYMTVVVNPLNPEKILKKEIRMSLSQWYIDPDRIGDFTSAIHGSLTPMDCVISAMQIIGFITNHESNLLRMTGVHGISTNNIIKLFTYISMHQRKKNYIENNNNIMTNKTNNTNTNTNNKVVFSDFRVYDVVYFQDKTEVIELVNTLKDSRICFVGHMDERENNRRGHVYCFFNNQGDIYLIDPQNKDYELTLCNNNDECEKIMTKGLQSDKDITRYYFALFRSDTTFSETDIETITNAMGFDLYRHGRRIY